MEFLFVILCTTIKKTPKTAFNNVHIAYISET